MKVPIMVFEFVGSCHDVAHACIHEYKCDVTETLIKITLPYLHADDSYLIEAYCLNPPYVSSASIEA